MGSAVASRSRNALGWLLPVASFIIYVLAFLSLSRALLVIWQSSRFEQSTDLLWVFLQGVRFDLISLAYLVALPLAITPFFLLTSRTAKPWARLLQIYLLAILTLFVFMEVATPPFVSEYDLRPNYLFAEYMKYPQELTSLLLGAFKLALFITAILVPVIVWGGHKVLAKHFSRLTTARLHPFMAVLLSLLILVLSLVTIRSSTGHRPANASSVVFSNDPLLNMLPLNSLYTLLSAVRESAYEEPAFAYGDFEREAIIRRVRQFMHLPPDSFIDDNIPTLHRQVATLQFPRRKNLIIVLEESLGAEFVGRMGGLPLTPRIDALAEEGIWFENLYATGTRSVRGIEAIITGFLPTPSPSVVKLPRSQSGFFSLAELLGRQGYDTSFIYGGSADFDNMRRFFSNNGFDTIIDEPDYEDYVFKGSWGVSDEDLLARANEYFLEKTAENEPFFSLVFTSTNHMPFEFPDDRIELYDEVKNTVNNAVKYADYAVGKFIDTARASEYWDDTLVLVIADHNSRVYGQQLVPVERFHIPGVILGGSISAEKVSRVTSQIDMIPTLLSLMGVDAEHPAIGLDLTRPDIDSVAGRALMQFGDNFAYMQGDKVLVLQKQQAPQQFLYANGELREASVETPMVETAMALSAWPFIAYGENSYRLPRVDE